MSRPEDAVLTVIERGKLLSYSFDDLMKYHGPLLPGGVAHGFKVMERAFPLLADGAPPERLAIAVKTAFPGPGARDAFEMVTRAMTGTRYVIDTAIAPPGTIEASTGAYFWRVAAGDRSIDLSVRPGMVRQEFIDLGRKRNHTPEELERIEWLKQEMADRLRSLPADVVYDARPTPAA